MRITRSQVRQIIREELSRLQESRRDDDEADDMEFYSGEEGGEEGEEGSGYEYLSRMPGTIEWIDGPVDKAWLSSKMRRYGSFPHGLRREIARDFEKMLMGMRVDPDIVSNYRNPDGTSNVTRQTVEALVDMLHSGR
jgi:hypothetical protein